MAGKDGTTICPFLDDVRPCTAGPGDDALGRPEPVHLRAIGLDQRSPKDGVEDARSIALDVLGLVPAFHLQQKPYMLKIELRNKERERRKVTHHI